MTKNLTMTARQHAQLRKYLFPGDGLESAAILLCRYTGRNRERLIVNNIINVRDEECSSRSPIFISWPGETIEDAIDRGEANSDAIILTHSHPGGQLEFSDIDDESDLKSMRALFSAVDSNQFHHGSAIMIPNGSMKVRLYDRTGNKQTIERIVRVGHNIDLLSDNHLVNKMPFGSEMTTSLAEQTACIIGVSGTGTLVAEQLARKGVGHLILIDFDIMKHKNLNRIVNSTKAHAEKSRRKVEIMADAVRRYSPNTNITTVYASIEDREAIVAASGADILFSCVDSMTGRSIAELISQAFVIPLIDLGVTIPTRTDENGYKQVADVCGRIDYVRPDGPNLSDRKVITPEGLRREYLQSCAPDAADKEIAAGYIKGVHEEAPSVMALNMRAAADAVMEWIARQFHFRHDGNYGYSRTFFSFAGGEVEYENESTFSMSARPLLGRGLSEPLLGIPSLGNAKKRVAA